MRRLVIAFVSVLALVLAAVGGLWLVQRRLIYFPDTTAVPPAGQVLVGASDVELVTADGLRLRAWLVPPTGRDRGFAVLSAPGNGGNRVGRIGLAQKLSAAGFTVLMIDYRGYGGNPGSPTAEGLVNDVRAARNYLVGAGWSAQRIIYLGESLGCAPLVALAAEYPPAGLVLRSPFASLTAAARYHYPFLPVRTLLRDRFPVAGPIARIRVATVVVYGTDDSIVPPEQSRRVAERAAGPVEVVIVPGADHNDPILFEGPPLIGAMTALADRLAPPEHGEPPISTE